MSRCGRAATGGGEVAALAGAGVILAECPLYDVEVMGAEVGDVAAGVVVEPSPVRVQAGGAEGGVWGGAEPEVVVQALGYGDGGGLGGVAVVVPIVTGQTDADLLKFAEAAIADELGGHAEMDIAALLRTRLPDDAGFAHGVRHESAFGDGEGERFFAIDVFASAGGGGGVQGVPVVRRGDLHSVDAGLGEEIAEVLVGGAAFALIGGVDEAAHGLAAKGAGFTDETLVVTGGLTLDITHGDDLDAVVIEEVFHHVVGAAPAADEAEGGAVGRGGLAIESEGAAGDDGGEAEGGSGRAEEVAAVDGVTHG